MLKSICNVCIAVLGIGIPKWDPNLGFGMGFGIPTWDPTNGMGFLDPSGFIGQQSIHKIGSIPMIPSSYLR